MKVAVVSDFVPGYDVGLEMSYVRALQTRGHQVERVSLRSRTRSPLRGLGRLSEMVGVLKGQASLRREVAGLGADLVLLIKGRGVLAESVRAWRREGLRVVNVFPDSPFEAAAVGLVGPSLLPQFRELDRLFVHDRFAVGRLREVGIRSQFIAFARDPAVHDPNGVNSSPARDAIVFVGNPDEERIRYLRAIADLGLGLYGQWEWARLRPSDPLWSCVRGGVQLGTDMVRALRSARLSINVLRLSQKTAHNMRTFEIPACGACCLSESSIGISELMEPGSEVVMFRTPEELRRLAVDLLASPSTVDSIARAGRARVEHETYARRVDEILCSL